MLRSIGNLISRILGSSAHYATACLLVGVALNLINIIGRYVFYASIPWAEEIMIYLMVASVFFGSAQASLTATHISMDIFIRDLPKAVKMAILLINDVILLVVAAVVMWKTIPVVFQLYNFDQRSEAARIPIYIPQMIIPIGFLLMMVGTLLHRIMAMIDPSDAQTHHAG
jgi:TRAP-type C4-dicarboxylate transport system permease small subunit